MEEEDSEEEEEEEAEGEQVQTGGDDKQEERLLEKVGVSVEQEVTPQIIVKKLEAELEGIKEEAEKEAKSGSRRNRSQRSGGKSQPSSRRAKDQGILDESHSMAQMSDVGEEVKSQDSDDDNS